MGGARRKEHLERVLIKGSERERQEQLCDSEHLRKNSLAFQYSLLYHVPAVKGQPTVSISEQC